LSAESCTAAVTIDASITVSELLAARPRAVRVFLDRNLACVGCTMARFDTLADVARIYRLDLADLNAALSDDAGVGEPGGTPSASPGDPSSCKPKGVAEVDDRGRCRPGPSAGEVFDRPSPQREDP
jgi:hybrid cluster-associated redox disulfide protein